MLKARDLDIVLIGTPDHWHALPMIEACKAGKDVYCEKPCAHNMFEARQIVAAAKKYMAPDNAVIVAKVRGSRFTQRTVCGNSDTHERHLNKKTT